MYKAIGAEGFHLKLRESLAQLRAQELQHGGAGTGGAAALRFRQGLEFRHLEGFDARGEGMEPQGEGAALRLREGLGNGVEVFHAFQEPRGRGAAAALEFEEVLGDGPAVVFLAHALARIHPHVVKEHLGLGGGAGDKANGGDGDAFRVHGQEQEGDAFLGAIEGARAHEAEHVRSVLGVGGPDLRAVQEVVIAVSHGAALERGQVRSGLGLGVALAPVVFPAKDAGKVVLLLRLRAAAQQRRAEHGEAHGGEGRRLRPGPLAGKDVALGEGPVAAAIFLGPARHEPALVIENLLPGQGVFLAGVHAGHVAPGVGELRRQGRGKEGPDLLAEGVFLGGEGELHGAPPLVADEGRVAAAVEGLVPQ